MGKGRTKRRRRGRGGRGRGREPKAYTCKLKKPGQLTRSFPCRCGADLCLQRDGVPGDQPKCPRCGRQHVVLDCNKKTRMIFEPEHAPVAPQFEEESPIDKALREQSDPPDQEA